MTRQSPTWSGLSGAQVDCAADVGIVLRRGVEGLLHVVHPTNLDGQPIDPRRGPRGR